MLSYIGVLLYLMSSVLHPGDWMEMFRDAPVDYIVFGFIAATSLVRFTSARMGRIMAMPITKMLLVYVVVQILSIAVQGNPDALLDETISHLKLLCVFFAIAVAVDSFGKIRWILILLVILAAFVSWQGAVLAETGTGMAGQTMYWGGRIRWVGMYNGANVLCMLLSISMAFVIQLVFGPSNWGIKLSVLGLSVLIVRAIYLTNSRGGFFALLVVVAVSVFLRGPGRRIKLSMKRVIPAGILAAVLLTVGPSRMESMDDKEKSTAGRFGSWQEGLEMLRSNPLTGVGSGQWQHYHRLLAHNSFVQTMGESGMAGLFCLVGIFYAVLRPLSALASRLHDQVEKSLALAVFGGLLAYLTTSFFLTTTQFDLLYIFAGLTVAICDLKGLNPTLTMVNYKTIGMISVGTVVLIYGSVRLYF